jgi:nicotinate-nucleotide adenylyltransferase
MGEDNLNTLHKWKNFEVILENHPIFVYPRVNNESESTFKHHPNVHFINAPLVEISSTFIRENIKAKKNVRPLLPEAVWNFIDRDNLYR